MQYACETWRNYVRSTCPCYECTYGFHTAFTWQEFSYKQHCDFPDIRVKKVKILTSHWWCFITATSPIITWYTWILPYLVESQVILNRITGFKSKNILKCAFKAKTRRAQCAWCVWRACVSKALPQTGNTVPYYLFDYGNMENINLNI